jgi:hypothetical protein
MLDSAGFALHDQQAAVVALGERLLRDAIGGQSEVVIARPPPAFIGA